MAVQRRVNFISQQRVDVPDMRMIESAASNDFDQLIQAFVTGTSQGYFLRGFNISMSGAIGGASNGLQVVVDPGAILHINASQSGTVMLVPSGTPNQQLNAATNPNVAGAFAPNAINYVGLDYIRFLDSTTDAQVYFWDPSTNTETTEIAPRANILTYVLNVSTTVWPTNILPIATVTTDAGNNVVSITDSRWLLARLGQGGASPNPFYIYPWNAQPEGRTENPSTSFSNSVDPFAGGDKMLGSLKDWMNAVMSILEEIKGTNYWYSLGTGGSIEKLREDLGNTVTTGVGTITHSQVTAGLVNWSDPIYMKVVGSSLSYQISANPSSSDILLADDEVAYITLARDIPIVPHLFYVYNSIPQTTTVTSIGSVPWTTSLAAGDFIRSEADPDSNYTKIKSVDSVSQVTLYGNYVPIGLTANGLPSVYALGTYNASSSPSTPRDIYISTRETVPVGQNVWWILLRADNTGIPRVYVRFLGSELEQGESEEIDSDVPIALLTYVGTSMQGVNSNKGPQYVASVYPGALPQITQITFGAGSTVSPSQYFTIASSANARIYYVWYKVNGTGTDPMPSAFYTGIEVDILNTDTANAVATKTRTALLALPNTDFSAPAPVGAVLTVTNTSAGTCTAASNVSMGAPFSIIVTQSGTGPGNYIVDDGNNLTLAIKKLDTAIGQMFAALDEPSYDEVVQIVASGATPPTSLNGPISSGTDITLPNNSRLGNIPQRYTVGIGSLQVYLNGQYLRLGVGWTEVGAADSASNQIQIGIDLAVGDYLEFRISVGGAAGGGGGVGPQGPAGPAGPTGPAGADAIGGPVAISTKTTNYSVMTSDNVLLANCASGAITFTLPTPSSATGQVFFLKKIDSTSNAMQIIVSGGSTIDGSSILSTNVQYTTYTVVSDGSVYWII